VTALAWAWSAAHACAASLSSDSGPALYADSLQVDQAIYLRDGFTATGGGTGVAVDLTGTRVGGALLADLGGLKYVTESDRLLAVDGLTYAGVPKLASARDWVQLLRHGTDRYAAQPYQQLAAGFACSVSSRNSCSPGLTLKRQRRHIRWSHLLTRDRG
jgi:hypothetical protein